MACMVSFEECEWVDEVSVPVPERERLVLPISLSRAELDCLESSSSFVVETAECSRGSSMSCGAFWVREISSFSGSSIVGWRLKD